ncbi:hypothetical protein QYQ98_03235 [Corynebacterium sp. P3-F1]|uniref:hypothetical protein n=1 Tax=Corynebacterium sp. P3-F1 TaxID=3059080 RepID=UPI00265D4271|nr:hypothetical protein [Corynebacterium sp. P3-F1]WKK61918.1 hypothetical protein QYQ98_03235 [Corynebacterium sp. P3-F1]
MTTTLSAMSAASNSTDVSAFAASGTASDVSTVASSSAAANDPSRIRCVLAISSMPRHLRLRVEGLMHEHLSEPVAAPSLVSVWDTPWFTRWRKEPSRAGTVSCREVIEAPAAELATFHSALAELAQTFRFDAYVAKAERGRASSAY